MRDRRALRLYKNIITNRVRNLRVHTGRTWHITYRRRAIIVVIFYVQFYCSNSKYLLEESVFF